MIYMLDTNIIIYFLKGTFPRVSYYLQHTPPDRIRVPAIVIAELEYGARLSKDYEANISEVYRFLGPFETAVFDETVASAYGRIRTDLRKSGDLIGANDMLIAATAVACEATLVTHNISEFSRVQNLKLCDWTE